MTDQLTCADARDLAPEVALGIAEARDRARLLGHIARCTGCQAFVAELSKLVDDVVALAPSSEPPPGFESRVLAHPVSGPRAHLVAAAGIRRRGLRPRLRALALGVAAAVVAAVVAGGVVHRENAPDRQLAESVRTVLATANGQYFTAAPLWDDAGDQRGALFAYQGDPPWIFISVRGPLEPGSYGVEVVTRAGAVNRLAEDVDLREMLSWGGAIPVAVHEVSVVRITRDGEPVLSAQIVLP